jgi:hypothetical protein
MWKWKKKQKANEETEEIPSSKDEEGQVSVATEEMPSSKEEEKVSEAIQETAASKEDEQVSTVTEEITPSNKEEEVSTATEKTSSPKEEEKAGEATQETTALKEEQISAVTEETPSIEEVSPPGVFIFGKRIESRFKKFITVVISIFLLPPVVLFGLLVITSVVLIAFPLISIALPITLLSLCILLIALPVVIPFLTVITLITGKGNVHFGLKNKKFAIKVLGITFPPHADRER